MDASESWSIAQRLVAYQREHGLSYADLIKRINTETEALVTEPQIAVFLATEKLPGATPRELQAFLTEVAAFLDGRKLDREKAPSEETKDAYDGPVFTEDERAVIRQKFIYYGQEHGIGVPTIAKRVGAPLKTMQRFLTPIPPKKEEDKDKPPVYMRSADSFTAACAEFAAKNIEYHDPAFDIGMALCRIYPLTLPFEDKYTTIQFGSHESRTREDLLILFLGELQTRSYLGHLFIGLTNKDYDGALINTAEGYIATVRDRFESTSYFVRAENTEDGFWVGKLSDRQFSRLELMAVKTPIRFIK
ncbi:hypothetical protein [Rhodopila sp.]|uniref:hypothetical protein n=1 Tax=Rhodopila sp. TaxID=2480087 RepID=UPI003D12AE02